LLDRIDIAAHMSRPGPGQSGPLTCSVDARAEVLEARARQRRRLPDGGAWLNARMNTRLLSGSTSIEEAGEEMLRRAAAGGLLSARGQDRTLRVARTIADLDGSARIRARDVGAALALRPESGPQ